MKGVTLLALKIVQPAEKIPFEQFYSRYYCQVLLYVMKKVGNRETAEDLTAEIFLYCYSHYDDYDSEKSALSTWLYLKVNSRIKNYYRDRKESVDISELENQLAGDDTDMSRSLYLEQLRDFVADALETLPERQQRIVILRYFRDKSSAEIAEIMEMTPGNVRVQLSRALDKLQNALQEFL